MMSGQSINDRITAARYSIAGQGLAKSVCKATTEEVIGPKKKHLDYLLHCTNEPNVSIPQLANLLIERTNQASWVIVFKALVTVHHLMCYGNERFTQYLASSNCHFQLSGFLDKTGVQGYDMSTFIRRYAKYLNEKALSYRTVAFDFCKVKRGKDEGVLRSMNAEKLVKTVPILQNQLDALLEFDCTANELSNGVINTAFMLLFRDLIRLFACYNDGIINLLEKYFDMNKKMCRDALDIYKKFLIRMDRVAEFLKVAENVGIDKGDIPDLTKAPGSLLDALEQHLAALEGKKGPGGATTPTGRQFSVKKGVLALSSTSNAFGSAAAAQAGFRQGEVNGVGVDESIRKIALEEEQAALNNHKERKFKELGLQSPTSGSAANTNPFLTSPAGAGDDAVNLFGSPTAGVPSGGGKASDDLLCLAGNPFADERPPSVTMVHNQHQQHFWGAQNGLASSVTPNATFVPETSFSAVFGSTESTQASLGVAKPPGAAPEVTVDMERDLNIPGLNPFANLSSNTPSPSLGPPELAGAGTTPILGGHSGFAFAFGGCADPSEKAMTAAHTDDSSAPFADFEAGFGHAAPPPRPPSPYAPPAVASHSHPFAAMDAGDFAFGTPSAKVPSPSPTPAPAPSPAFTTPQGGMMGGAAFDFSVSDSTGKLSPGGAGSPAHSQGFSAFDDLNTTIRAALSLSGSGGGSQTASPCRGPVMAVDGSPRSRSLTPALIPSGGVPAVQTLAQASSSSSSNSSFGFGSPSKSANTGAAAAGKGFDAFGDILQPMPTMATSASGNLSNQMPATGGGKSQSKVITGDLDSSLASLVQNLEINRGAPIVQKGPHVWNSPKNMAKTGGANWTPHVAGSTAGAGPWNSPQHNYQPMGGVRPAAMGATTIGQIPQQNVMAPMFGAAANAGPRPAVQQQRPMDPFGNL